MYHAALKKTGGYLAVGLLMPHMVSTWGPTLEQFMKEEEPYEVWNHVATHRRMIVHKIEVWNSTATHGHSPSLYIVI
jgi:hypothetical protein